MQLKVVLDEKSTGGEPIIGLRVPTAADNKNDDDNDDATGGVVVKSSAKKKRKKDDDDHEEPRIPTTEELWDYATGRVVVDTTNNDNNNNNPQQQQQHQDDYHKIVQLQQECLQKADEKVAVAQQSFEMIDSVVQRLDRDLATMESLLQVRACLCVVRQKGICLVSRHYTYLYIPISNHHQPFSALAFSLITIVVMTIDLQSVGDFQQGIMAKPNDLAACQVTPGSEWILAKVIQHDPTTGIYKLADEDVESNKSTLFVIPCCCFHVCCFALVYGCFFL